MCTGVTPSCTVWAIRSKFPSPDGSYIPFAESKIDEDNKPQESIDLAPETLQNMASFPDDLLGH